MTYRREVLPSSDSVQAAIRGERGALMKVALSTALRALLILPGAAIGGARGGRLIVGSLLSSATITAALFLFYRRPMIEEAMASLPTQDPVLADTVGAVASDVRGAIADASAAAPGMQGLRGVHRLRRR